MSLDLENDNSGKLSNPDAPDGIIDPSLAKIFTSVQASIARTIASYNKDCDNHPKLILPLDYPEGAEDCALRINDKEQYFLREITGCCNGNKKTDERDFFNSHTIIFEKHAKILSDKNIFLTFVKEGFKIIENMDDKNENKIEKAKKFKKILFESLQVTEIKTGILEGKITAEKFLEEFSTMI